MASKMGSELPKSTINSLKKASVVIEDLLYALKKVKSEELLDAIVAMDQIVSGGSRISNYSAVAQNYQSPDPNKRFLIGVLPRLLQDRRLFPSNEDIIEFSGAALGLPMSRTSGLKRARHEIIGKIICETELLDEQRLTDIVRALEGLVEDKDKLASMIEKKKAGNFSWNETLQQLLRS